jgi:hypothetical protein
LRNICFRISSKRKSTQNPKPKTQKNKRLKRKRRSKGKKKLASLQLDAPGMKIHLIVNLYFRLARFPAVIHAKHQKKKKKKKREHRKGTKQREREKGGKKNYTLCPRKE